jgi:hypothetical protein
MSKLVRPLACGLLARPVWGKAFSEGVWVRIVFYMSQAHEQPLQFVSPWKGGPSRASPGRNEAALFAFEN